MNMIYKNIQDKVKSGKTVTAVLLDPDKYSEQKLNYIVSVTDKTNVDFFLVGGSIISTPVDEFVRNLKEKTSKPVVLFPGSLLQLSTQADGILLLSLISGRNPDLLIGNHVIAAPLLKKSEIEIISTSYILVGTGKATAVEYMSNTKPIPENKSEIVIATALAGEMLGHKIIYLEAGSGASEPINKSLIKEIKSAISIPLMVGGGIRTRQQYQNAVEAGADIIVLGNVLEDNPDFLRELSS